MSQDITSMETVTESPVETPPTSTRQPLPHAFTCDNAVAMQKRSSKSRERGKKKALAISPENYVKARLRRVRAQLKQIDELIEGEVDPQKLDRLVSAQTRLSEQWRIFSGIPLPGSRRPGRESSKDKLQSFEPSE